MKAEALLLRAAEQASTTAIDTEDDFLMEFAALFERVESGWWSYQETSIGQRILEVARAYLGESA